mmetsp:Transcript_5178/g.765  ORF Transcript_5178/g.765 Transcript_5178/m.765 type:complete len:145 (+) Transcript_5178:49-483(+)
MVDNSAKAQKRLQNELKQCQGLEGVSVTPDASNNLKWDVILHGPENTPYKGGFFNVKITFPAEYPFKFPEFTFATPIYHPNVDKNGLICTDMIGEKDWVPTKKVSGVIQVLLSIFSEVNDNVFNEEAHNLYKSDKAAYEKKVAE